MNFDVYRAILFGIARPYENDNYAVKVWVFFFAPGLIPTANRTERRGKEEK